MSMGWAHSSIVRASLLAAVLATAGVASKGYSAEVTLEWDHPQPTAVAGYTLYCGSASRNYATRIDAGNTLTLRASVPEGVLTFCAVRAYDSAGYESSLSNEVGLLARSDAHQVDVLPPFTVQANGWVQPTATGVQVGFALPFDATWLNLYGSSDDADSRPDVTLAGAMTGAVKGSLVVSQDRRTFTVLKTGGVLLPDTYMLTVASRPYGVADQYGRALEEYGTAFQDYRVSFAIAASDAPVLAIGEFARGPGQPVNLPASEAGAGIPVRISKGAAVAAVSFVLRYDPALLTVQAVSLGPSIQGNLSLGVVDATAGAVRIEVTNLSGLSSASTVLLRLHAVVPADAPYRSQHLLDIRELSFNGGALAGQDDDGLHVVAKLGNCAGQDRYSSYDALLVQRVIVRLDSGFSAFPLVDPIIIGDVNATARLDSHDAMLIQLKVLGQAVPEVPD